MNYKLIEKLNESGSTWIVADSTSHRRYVRKLLPSFQLERYLTLRQLKTEKPSLHIPNIIEIERIDDERIAIYEQEINGSNLAQILTKPLDEATAKQYILELLAILRQTHSAGIIHRDIKPSNIIIDDTQRLWLIDFGIARSESSEKTEDTIYLGTHGYAAPEQFGFGQSDERTDIYAVGILLNVMLTGAPPKDNLALGSFSNIIKKCISLDPTKRYQNVQELERAFRSPYIPKIIAMALIFVVAFACAMLIFAKKKPMVVYDAPSEAGDLSDFSDDVSDTGENQTDDSTSVTTSDATIDETTGTISDPSDREWIFSGMPEGNYEIKEQENIRIDDYHMYSYTSDCESYVTIQVNLDSLRALSEYNGMNLAYFMAQKGLTLCLELYITDEDHAIPKELINYIKDDIDILNIYVNTADSDYDLSYQLSPTLSVTKDILPYLKKTAALPDNFSDATEKLSFCADATLLSLGEMSKISIRSIDGQVLHKCFPAFFEKYCISDIATTDEDSHEIFYGYGEHDYTGEHGRFELYSVKNNETSLIIADDKWSRDLRNIDEINVIEYSCVEFWDIRIGAENVILAE